MNFLLYEIAHFDSEMARASAWEDVTCFTALRPSSPAPPSSALAGSFGSIAEFWVYDGSQVLFMSLELR